MFKAAESGHVEIVKLYKEWGATDLDAAMIKAAREDHIEILKLCKKWGATNFNSIMRETSCSVNVKFEVIDEYRIFISVSIGRTDGVCTLV